MADLPTKKISINIGQYYVTYEANSENPSAGQILSVAKNDTVLDPTSSEAISVASDETTQLTLKNSLKIVNRDLYTLIFGES